jgi:hypothetical protein
METLDYGVCDCGNRIDYKEMGDGAECCEWCLPENRFDGIMWRERGDWLEQVETHGFDRLHTVEFFTGESVSVWANSFEIAEYIAGEWLAQQEVNA